MPKSIEHSPKFHMVRRIATVIAPDFRILARQELSNKDTVLDMNLKTIEVSEKATEFEMVGAVLFQLGHLRLRSNKKYAEHFGNLVLGDCETLIVRLVGLGVKADGEAFIWAKNIFINNFNVDDLRAEAILRNHCWNKEEWLEYYSF